jgi:hypothetical protein
MFFPPSPPKSSQLQPSRLCRPFNPTRNVPSRKTPKSDLLLQHHPPTKPQPNSNKSNTAPTKLPSKSTTSAQTTCPSPPSATYSTATKTATSTSSSAQIHYVPNNSYPPATNYLLDVSKSPTSLAYFPRPVPLPPAPHWVSACPTTSSNGCALIVSSKPVSWNAGCVIGARARCVLSKRAMKVMK